ncbi:Glutamate racemase 2 [compost metagenome]
MLGCTHFPYFTNVIKELFPQGTDFISGSIGTANNLKRILECDQLLESGSGHIAFYNSGIRVEDTATLERYGQLLRMLDEL